MNYITFAFVIFTAVTVLLYYLWPWKKYQWCVLLAASYVFYCSSSVRMAVWMVITSIVIYLCALGMEKLGDAEAAALHRKKPDGTALLRPEKKALKAAFKRKRRALLTFGLLIIFGILAFFKYIPGLVSGISGGRFTMNLLLPIGISFYTFQSAGYLIDVYNGQSRAEKNFFKIALFVSFFPQIVQGPISFYDQLGQQLYEEHKPDWRGFKYGLSLILFGYLEKMVLADRIVGYIYQVSDNYTQYSGTLTGLAILLYALQLYADFAGGINISIGIAQLFGISLQQNFRQPYFSASINDYWRRWHITLGAWMKKYIFYPLALTKGLTGLQKKLGKSDFGKTEFGRHLVMVLPASLSCLVVFLVVGIWHGAGMKYVAFGLWNGIIIMISMIFEPVFKGWNRKLSINEKSAAFRIFQCLRTFLLVYIGYVFDVGKNFRACLGIFSSILTRQNFRSLPAEIHSVWGDFTSLTLVIVLFMTALLFAVDLWHERHPGMSLRGRIDAGPFVKEWFMVTACVITIVIFGVYGPGVNPVKFVYMNF